MSAVCRLLMLSMCYYKFVQSLSGFSHNTKEGKENAFRGVAAAVDAVMEVSDSSSCATQLTFRSCTISTLAPFGSWPGWVSAIRRATPSLRRACRSVGMLPGAPSKAQLAYGGMLSGVGLDI